MSPPIGRSVGAIALLGFGRALYGGAYGSAAGLALISSIAFISIKSPSPDRNVAPRVLRRSVSAPGALSSLLQPQSANSLPHFTLPQQTVWTPYEEERPSLEPSSPEPVQQIAPPPRHPLLELAGVAFRLFKNGVSDIRAAVSRAKAMKDKIVYLRRKKVNWEERFGSSLEIGETEGALERTTTRGGGWAVMPGDSAAAEELLIDWGRRGGPSIKTILVGSLRNLCFSKGCLKRIDYRVLDGLFHHRPELIDALEEGGELRYIFHPNNVEEIAKCRAQCPSFVEERLEAQELHVVFTR